MCVYLDGDCVLNAAFNDSWQVRTFSDQNLTCHLINNEENSACITRYGSCVHYGLPRPLPVDQLWMDQGSTETPAKPC